MRIHDPDLPRFPPAADAGVAQVEHPVESYLETPGKTFRIEAGAVWDLTDTPTHTTVSLRDCADPRLRGLTVTMDWAQVHAPRPDVLQRRFESIVLDTDLLTDHLMRHHHPRILSRSTEKEPTFTLVLRREQLQDLVDLAAAAHPDVLGDDVIDRQPALLDYLHNVLNTKESNLDDEFRDHPEPYRSPQP